MVNSAQDLKLRKAKNDDAEFVLECRNDPQTRKFSFSEKLIDYDLHMEWFKKKIDDPDCFFFILIDGSERIGQIRVDRVNDIGEVSYAVASNKRGRGYGKAILKLCESVMPADITVLMGTVKKENIPSRKCFQFNGYSQFECGDLICFIKTVLAPSVKN
jgi:spore coat polysaccharide biosynthesis protein SpsF